MKKVTKYSFSVEERQTKARFRYAELFGPSSRRFIVFEGKALDQRNPVPFTIRIKSVQPIVRTRKDYRSFVVCCIWRGDKRKENRPKLKKTRVIVLVRSLS